MTKVVKICTHCREPKPLAGFYNKKAARDGHQSWCSECMLENHRRRKALATKVCTSCGQAKPMAQYARHAKTKDRLSPWCSPCRHEPYARKRLEIRAKWRAIAEKAARL